MAAISGGRCGWLNTNALTIKFFADEIGLIDIKEEIDRRRKLEKLSKDFFDDLEDSLKGGEAEVVVSWFD